MPTALDPDEAWLNTASGRAFYPFRPTPDMIVIEDIARGLSNTCRYTGQVTNFYSVCEHSVLVSLGVKALGGTDMEQLWGLLHDASEAYLVDVPSPLKHHPGMAFYRETEAKVMAAVCQRFGLPPNQPQVVSVADSQMLSIEAPVLIAKMAKPWGLAPVLPPLASLQLRCERPLVAERAFMARFGELSGLLGI